MRQVRWLAQSQRYSRGRAGHEFRGLQKPTSAVQLRHARLAVISVDSAALVSVEAGMCWRAPHNRRNTKLWAIRGRSRAKMGGQRWGTGREQKGKRHFKACPQVCRRIPYAHRRMAVGGFPVTFLEGLSFAKDKRLESTHGWLGGKGTVRKPALRRLQERRGKASEPNLLGAQQGWGRAGWHEGLGGKGHLADSLIESTAYFFPLSSLPSDFSHLSSIFLYMQ